MASTKEPIAIIGSACRFPGGSSSPSKLWDLLKEPRDVLVEFPEDRLALSNFHNTDGSFHGSTNVVNKSYLLSEDIRTFDASFFQINTKEAESMDPAQRILLETVYEALESAGYPLERVDGSDAAVFAGLMTADWWDLQMRDTETLSTYAATGTARSMIANRISFFFNLKGASMTVDTACSSSLVALHQAVQTLRNGESKTAIVTGANLILDPTVYISESKLHMLSPTSRSRMFDKSADGYARGEGFAAVLLKPLSRAIADGDHIESLIRETGVNSDGRTPGITMPSAAAQIDLIRSTYRRAGLDPVLDRPQFFECHGTGTAVGDPIEAEAIATSFFPPSQHGYDGKLLVGSIKTVIGHLEGCSGLAGVLKASLAIQNRIIPPNLLFEELNPDIAPYYENLRVVQAPTPWPSSPGTCRRAGVNSFGFGGTNTFAILESYDDETTSTGVPSEQPIRGPLVLSARSSSSLVNMVRDYAEYISSHSPSELDDLVWVLLRKRGNFDLRQSFSGSNQRSLLKHMRDFVESTGQSDLTNIGPLFPDDPPAILGIFTGQGAQWATMGASLARTCRVFRESLEHSEAVLATLPNPPSWSLQAELLADPETSRLGEAELSQPLCTALQIAMVDLAMASGLKFKATVGHSSGEIAAAYAAGIITARNAMAIAYYRGVYAIFAAGPDGQPGGMMAVSISYESAVEFCSLPQWSGRISPAASNAPSSVTLSGDLDAILEARTHFDQIKIFARQLKVDTAYHSQHMLPCARPYLKSLEALRITLNEPSFDCTWCSSVLGGSVMEGNSLESLRGQYWVDNMVKPVLFSEAVETAIWNGGPFELAMEIGPHAALKGPVTQVIKSVLDSSPPYIGFMCRGEDATAAFSEALGTVWSKIGPAFVDLDGYRRAFGLESRKPRVLKGLPSYPWDHDKTYWREGRISRNYRLRRSTPHELLGRRVPNDMNQEMRWRNILHLAEIPWMRGHKFQGQVLFPAAAHIVQAIEAAKHIQDDRPIKLIELENVCIHHSIVLNESSPGIETSFTLKVLNNSVEKDVITAEFSSYSAVDAGGSDLKRALTGRINLHVGDGHNTGLPPVTKSSGQMSPIDIQGFYGSMKKLGLEYQDHFQGLTRAEQASGKAQTIATWQGKDSAETQYLVHPVLLDLAFQANLIPMAATATGIVQSLYLPTTMRRLLVDPARLSGFAVPGGEARIGSFVTQLSASCMTGDLHVLDVSGDATSIQIEGLLWKALSESTPTNDRLLFSRTVWDLDIIDGAVQPEGHDRNGESRHGDLIETMERTALFHMRCIVASSPPEHIKSFAWHHQQLLEAISVKLDCIRCGQNPAIQQSWLDDNIETIRDLQHNFPNQIELELMQALSKRMISIVRGDIQILEVMMENDMLSRFYMESAYALKLNKYVASVTRQLSHKYPQAKFLEIGAGTGGTTRSILDSIGASYSSYTYTDVSSGFFQKASDKFSDHLDKMVFKVLNVEEDLSNQGYKTGAFDIVVAANVLHATRTLSDTVRHVRSLLKPGGYLVLMEVTGDSLMATYTMGGLPGWWLGLDDGRRFNPGVSVGAWDSKLKQAGFSGVDSVVYDSPDIPKHTFSVIVTQAVDEQFNLIRNPLAAEVSFPKERLLVISSNDPLVSKLAHDLQHTLPPFNNTIVVDGIGNLKEADLASISSVISLTELATPVFASSMTDDFLKKLQLLFSKARRVLWLTQGRTKDSPLSNMVVGLGRSLHSELPHLTLQFLDTSQFTTTLPAAIARTFCRLVIASEAKFGERNVLWTIEPEIRLEGDKTTIPRIVLDEPMNERFNAAHRHVTRKIDKRETCVELFTNDYSDRLILRETAPLDAAQGIVIDVHYSTGLMKGYQICLGAVRGTSKIALAWSKTISTSICVPESDIFVLPDGPAISMVSLLMDTTSHVLARKLIDMVPSHGAALIYEPTSQLAAAMKLCALSVGKKIFFASSSTQPVEDEYLFVHVHATERAIREIMPKNISCFIDLGSAAPEPLVSSLPFGTLVHSSTEGIISSADCRLFGHVVLEVLRNPSDQCVTDATDVQGLVGAIPASSCYPQIVDWTRTKLIATVRGLDVRTALRPDRTYLLVGMTGDLGRSLCRWMVANGARNVVLTSRSATVDHVWLREMGSLGATIKVFKMDVSDRRSVQEIRQAVNKILPPIAGVCNAAMVLEDKLFVDMTAGALNKVLAPKVKGSQILDEIFNHPELDFFVLFSSVASVFGNPGQSNYHAANLFMEGLCEQRRARGLPASIMHIGFITDVGYVARSSGQFKSHLSKLSLELMSEADMHHLFGEAILNSRQDAEARLGGGSRSCDIIAGIKPFVDSADNVAVQPPFYKNPQFSHFVHDENGASSSTKDSGERAAPRGAAYQDVKQRLTGNGSSLSEIDTAGIIQDAFAADLEVILQMAPNSVKADRSLTSLGLDSLIAFEIRAWFRKAVSVDVPVLRVLQGDSVAAMCADVAKMFLAMKIE